MTEPPEPGPLKRTIPPDLQKDVEDIQTKVPRNTGPPGDLDEEKKRWLIIGICLHSIISPLLRKYVDPILSNLYSSLVSSNFIDTQSCNGYLKQYPVTNRYYLNYESVNNNRRLNKNYRSYDYKVTSHVDLSKLFLQPNMAQYTGFNESCDSSALLGLVINISSFPPIIQTDAEKIRSDIRNPWAHCDFREWTTGKYTDLFNLMGQLVKDIGLSNIEENRILGELNTWATNGQHFLSGTTLGLEIVGEIRQQTHILSSYVQTLCSEADSQFIGVQEELTRIDYDLQQRIQILESKTKEHNETLDYLKKEIKNQVEDHIPKHIRAQHGQDIREWEQDQTTFLETRATRQILEYLPTNNCIVVTGCSGCGKSSNIHHAALHLRDSLEYEIIPVLTGPTDIINYYNENKKQVFIVDDICGKETINMQTLQTWRDYSEKMEKIFKVAEKYDKTVSKVLKPKLLVSCRLHIYNELQFQRITLFKKKECNLLSPELCLLEAERMDMLHRYLPDDIIDNIKQVSENVHYFPLLCKLSKDKTSEEVKKLFTAPLKSIVENIENIIIENRYQFCALVLCILFNGGFNTDRMNLLSASQKKENKLEDIVKEFDIDLRKEKHRNSLKSGFSTLNGTFFKLRDMKYRMIHDKIYKMAAVICGQRRTECFIKYAPPEFIQNHFIFESLMEANVGGCSIILLKNQEEKYFERLLCDLNKRVITRTFHNFQLKFKRFRDKLVSYLRRSDDAKRVLRNFDIQGCPIDYGNDNKRKYWFDIYYTTPLIESAMRGYFDIVHFLIVNVKCDVNNTDSIYSSPLYKASERGRYDVAKFLLENNADLSLCNKYKMSAFYVACKKGHKDTVELLLQNIADVNQCDNCGKSPLHVVCKRGHTDLVEMLLENNADVHQCDTYGKSPLHEACYGGHTDIVEVLLENNADVNQCDSDGASPLYAACNAGHKDIVEVLLQNKADVSQCNKYGTSPLHAACVNEHRKTVELLLQNNADINQCDRYGDSPLLCACVVGNKNILELLLQNKADISQRNNNCESSLYKACEGGHIDIVELLMQNKADVSRNYENRISPLNAACKEGHTDVVELLLQKKVDPNKSDLFTFPLYEACEEGYTNIVELLLQNNADVNQCDMDGESPLYAACKDAQKDTVELLLQNNAGVNQCNRYGQSPLYVACEGGHKDTVELLLQNKADVNQCNKGGKSPLYAACEGGHKDIVELLLQNNVDVNQYESDCESPLCVACRGGYTDIVDMLFQSNADVNRLNKDVESSLCEAFETGYKDIVDMLLQHMADVNTSSEWGNYLWFVACYGGHKDIVELLLHKKADVNQCMPYGQSLLCTACEGGHKDIIELLLQKKAEVNQCNENGESPLYLACRGGHYDILELLLQNKADVNQCTVWGTFPLFFPFNRGHKDTVELLLQNQADLNQCYRWGDSPLLQSCDSGHKDMVELLLQKNADVNQCNKNGKSPLFGACRGGHTNIVELLLQNNADVNQCNNNGESPLFVACERGHTNTVKVLLQNNADINQCNYRVESSLFVACTGGHTDTVEFLLQNNADLSQCDYTGNSSLYVACANGHEDTVELLLKNNADVSKCNSCGMSPLYVACKFRRRDTVKLLLQKNADVSQCEQQDRKSPLHVACELRIHDNSKPTDKFWDPNIPCLYSCIRADDPDLEDTYQGTIETVKLLLAWNGDVNLCDKKGQTPLDYARKSQDTRIVKLLEKNHQIQASNLK
ncbi:serine/threonine-protein phosphatase 6 regulatory ankyrin repeat subunit C-like [Mytilus edulis]|uniref:serine/threonine-protein phosphatase 6 regulatory ankyrin repeat subunit C-like n=1 Tax=Mytilus edulis TaxID=6550 RepID=UPI0039EF12EC